MRSPATPWQSLPPDLTDTLRTALAGIAPDLIETIQREVPEYARPMEGRFGDGVHRGIGVALDRFLDLPGTTEPALTDVSREVYRGLGSGEVRQGRSLDSLLAAYRTGARVVFRTLADAVANVGAPTSVIVALGESIFAYIDEVSAMSVEGYALEQSARASDLDRRRSELVSLLLAGGADDATLHRLAVFAGWQLPDEIRIAVAPAEHADAIRGLLGPRCLVTRRSNDTIAVLPARLPRQHVDEALARRGAVVGPGRPWAQAQDSARLAALLGGQAPTPGGAAAGEVPSDATGAHAQGRHDSATGAPLWVDEHLLAVVLAAEASAVADLARTRLAPLGAERPASRERLAETLLAWLAHDGRRGDIGKELHIHAQTVGYRVGRLRELFGTDLDDPTTRFELELVLRAGHG